MATTWYVSTLNGSDLNSGRSPDQAVQKLGVGLALATTPGDIVEIIDEGTYTENWTDYPQLRFPANDITLTHTASALGRPTIDAGSTYALDLLYRTGITLNGLHITNTTNAALYKVAGTDLTISDCFFSDVTELSHLIFAGDVGRPALIKQSSFLFKANGGISHVRTNGYVEIENCFFSASYEPRILEAFSTQTTASFSTFIVRGNGNAPAVKFGKVINCIVSASSAATQVDGIASDDHDYNLVSVQSTERPWLTFSEALGSAGGADIEGEPTFVDGTSVGNSYSVVANYALASDSLGIDRGTAFNNIFVDITGTLRPQGSQYDMGAFEFISQDPTWTDGDGTQTYPTKFGSSFTIHRTANTLATRTFAYGTENRQAPYYVSIAGPATIRQRSGSYKAET